MNCPVCGSELRDGSDYCHVCQTYLGGTRTAQEGTWCPSCGAYVEPGRRVCPNCLMPLDGDQWDEPTREWPSEDDVAAAATHAMPRLVSAIPAEETERTLSRRHPVSMRALVVATVCAVLAFGAIFLLVAHPWDPNLFDTRATTPADTSHEGFPGTLEHLQGQDTSASGAASPSGSAAPTAAELLQDAKEQLEQLNAELDEEYETLRTSLYAGDFDDGAHAEARATQVAISNAITSIEEIGADDAQEQRDQEELIRLGNYLRNRSDAICACWDEALGEARPFDEILSTLTTQNSTYKGLFEDGIGEV